MATSKNRQSSWASSEKTRKSMRANRRRDTTPELALRRELWKAGLRYRVDARVLAQVARRADLSFRRERIAVFVDGCFWHMCSLHRTVPATNREFWEAKLKANRVRDLDTDRRLVAEGWLPIRLWSHEDPSVASIVVAEAVFQRRSARVR